MSTSKRLVISFMVTERTTVNNGRCGSISFPFGTAISGRLRIRSTKETDDAIRSIFLLGNSANPLDTFSLNTIILLTGTIDTFRRNDIESFAVPAASTPRDIVAVTSLTPADGITEVVSSGGNGCGSVTSSSIDVADSRNLNIPVNQDHVTDVFSDTRVTATGTILSFCLLIF